MMTFLLQKKQWVFHWSVGWFDLSVDPEAFSQPSQTSKMELFAEIANI